MRGTKAKIPTTGWAAEILSERNPEGWWVNPRNYYQPEYLSTNWKLLVLSDLGLTRVHPAVRASCEWWMERSATRYAWLAGTKGSPHLCVAGNMARALIRFGYADDRLVRLHAGLAGRDRAPEGRLVVLDVRQRARDRS